MLESKCGKSTRLLAELVTSQLIIILYYLYTILLYYNQYNTLMSEVTPTPFFPPHSGFTVRMPILRVNCAPYCFEKKMWLLFCIFIFALLVCNMPFCLYIFRDFLLSDFHNYLVLSEVHSLSKHVNCRSMLILNKYHGRVFSLEHNDEKVCLKKWIFHNIVWAVLGHSLHLQ